MHQKILNRVRLQAVLDAALKTGKEEGVLESVRKNGERFIAFIALTLRKDTNGNHCWLFVNF